MSKTADTSRRQARWLVLRAVVVPVVVLAALATYFVASRALAVNEATTQITQVAPRVVEQPWRSAYSRRFPGCVATVLWPDRKSPQAVVVQWRSGEVERVERGAALRRALSASRADDGRIIGACYR